MRTFICLAVVLLFALPATAQRVECRGTLSGVFDEVIVPEGSFCILHHSVVRRHVIAYPNAILAAFNNTIGGDIEGLRADVVQVRHSIVRGDIRIRKGGPHPFFFEALVCDNIITEGDIWVEKMIGSVAVGPVAAQPEISAFCAFRGNHLQNGSVIVKQNFLIPERAQGLDVRRNTVQKHMHIFNNEGPAAKLVQENVIKRHLHCHGNTPPFIGHPNAAEKFLGDCGGKPNP